MELKNLLNKLKVKEEKPRYFFAIEISDDIVKSAVWTVFDGHTKVIKIGASQPWDGQNQDKLLSSVDQSISDASDNLNPEPVGVIFGLPESWIEKEEINADKKTLLKSVCQSLELKPLGFVVTAIAVTQYLKIEEGTPPSAIFLHLNSSEINLSLVKLGKIIGTQLVGRSGDLGPDVEEGLSRFEKIDTLPSRMILYNGSTNFEEDKQQLISYDWEEKLPFIHFPKVESLATEVSIKAIALAGGSEVAKSLGFEIKPPPKSDLPQSTPATTAADLGFTAQDIVDSQDFQAISPTESTTDNEMPLESEFSQQSSHKSQKFVKLTQLIKSAKESLVTRLQSFKSLSKTPRILTVFIIGIFTIFTCVFAAYWYLPKAEVVIYIESQVIEKALTLTIDPNSTTPNFEDNILPGKSLDVEVSGSQSIPTTGTSLVGDASTGKIIIYNKTNSTKIFNQGTVLIGPSNLSFTLDDEVSVASRSSSEDSDGIITITPGKADAQITAKSIGPEGNLAADVKISFKQYSDDDFYAKTVDGLSGGSAREVKAVSQNDQTNLLDSLTLTLKQKAQAELSSQSEEGKALIDIANKDEVTSKSFNYDIGEETDTLSLEAQLQYSALSYSKQDLNLLLEKAIHEKIPDNFQLSQSSQIDIQPAVIKSDNTAEINVIFKAQLIPKLDLVQIKNNLKGRYPQVVKDYLATLPGFVKADIATKPNLPKNLKTLPRVTKHINIEIKSAE